MSNNGSLDNALGDGDFFTGLIGYTSGGIPFPLDPNERVHRGTLSDMDSTGGRSVRLYFKKDLKAFQKVVAEYSNTYSNRASVANLERWDTDDIVTGAKQGDVPLPPGNSARVAK